MTGAAGFIGYQTAYALLSKGYHVIGLDNMNDYYDVRLKEYRLNTLKGLKAFTFFKIDIEDYKKLQELFKKHMFDGVINLAARAGVRYSMIDPFIYSRTNIIGTLNLLHLCNDYGIKKFILASTSSLYAGHKMPFKEDLPVNKPLSPYAASKKGAEAMAYTYHFLYNLDVTVLRYFTVYGPVGRPDMCIFRFIKWINDGTPIDLYGDGTQQRDFTFVDDIAEGTVKAYETETGFEIINLGGNKPYELNHTIKLIEQNLGKNAKRNIKPFHKADLMATWADITKAKVILGWEPLITLEEGIERTVKWYRENIKWAKNIMIDIS